MFCLHVYVYNITCLVPMEVRKKRGSDLLELAL